MCGIFAYSGPRTDAATMILDGLKSLEYRGYDSWGVTVKQNNGKLFTEKHTGKIGDSTLPQMESSIGFGHTRWATHGGVTEANAHPHADWHGDIVVVHNGIVENFEQLKSNLIDQGHKFLSETDTEVIAHLAEELMKTEKDSFKVVQQVKAALHGMNAVIMFFPKEDAFFVFKNGSPIVLGKGENELFLASDPSAIRVYTADVYFLEDGEMLSLKGVDATLFDEDGKIKQIEYQKLAYEIEDAMLGNYPHFMLKEINEQPKVLQQIIDTQKDIIQDCADKITEAYGTYLVGCGTASYACLAGTYLFSKIAKRHVNFAIGSEFTYLIDFIKKESLVIALSQSGETIDIISAMKEVKAKGAQLSALTNVLGSTLYRLADHRMLLQAGPEKAVASTKAYTAKIAFLYLIAHALDKSYETGVANLSKAILEVRRIVKQAAELQEMAKKITASNNIFVLGRGVSYAAALESALKIKEVSYIHAEGFAAGELKHGVIALIEKGTPVIIFNPEDETYEDTLSAAHEVKARGAYVIGISSRENAVYDQFIKVENCKDATIIPNVVIAQLLGYYLAIERGLDPDKPRNLAKSVTVK
ncbi:MAG: glutamine--fructose-6-phosphate transaminase (isomerizing) [Weeksellaceae bacterium]